MLKLSRLWLPRLPALLARCAERALAAAASYRATPSTMALALTMRLHAAFWSRVLTELVTSGLVTVGMSDSADLRRNILSLTLANPGALAVLAASAGDALAANVLLERVGLEAVRNRLGQLGMPRSALLDGFRDSRGPDDAPHVALGTAAEMSELFSALVNSSAVNPSVSAHVAEWLSRNHDLSLVASATGLDPFAHDNDDHGLLFINKTGRGAGIRAEAGVLAGPRAGVSYALIVCFDDLSIMHRSRAHAAFRVLGTDLMEYVY